MTLPLAESPSDAVMSATITALRASASLMALVNGAGVYNSNLPPGELAVAGDVRSGPPNRYVVLSDLGERPVALFNRAHYERGSLTIGIFTLDIARGDGADHLMRRIYGEIYKALHNQVLALPSPFVMLSPGDVSRSISITDPPTGGIKGIARYDYEARAQ